MTWGNALFERVLDEVAEAGYHGLEVHQPAVEAFGRQPGRLRAVLEQRGLAVSAAPFPGWYFERSERPDELERLRRLAGLMGEVGEQGLIVFRAAPHPARRDMVAGEAPLLPLTRDRIGHLADALNQYCDVCSDLGLAGAFQNRVGSFVETPDEYEQVIERTERQLVGLAPDLGHWAYAGGDPIALVRTHRERIVYPRLKDFDQRVFDRMRDQRLGFTSFVSAGGFKELGEGTLDLEAALRPLANAGHARWVCVELERAERPAKESAKLSRDYLSHRLHW